METLHEEFKGEYVSHQVLMQDAREALKGNWGLAIGVAVVFFIISIASNFIPGAGLLIGGPLAMGVAFFYLNLVREKSPEFNNLFDGFKYFGASLGLYLIQMILIFLGIIFFIIPGIILAIGLSQSYYVLADNPEMSPVDALRESWDLMKGRKMDYFILCLRFIPWLILSIITLGIGFLFLQPYMATTFANYYDNLIGEFQLAGNKDEFEYH